MEKYTIICDPSETPDDTKNIMEDKRFRKVIKEVRLWSFLQNMSYKIHNKNVTETNHDAESEEIIFQLDSYANRVKRKFELDELMMINKKTNISIELYTFVKKLKYQKHIRKLKNPIKNKTQVTNGYHFRAIRKNIGYQKVRRSPFTKIFFEKIFKCVSDESSIENKETNSTSENHKPIQNLKRKSRYCTNIEPIKHVTKQHIDLDQKNSSDFSIPISTAVIENICIYHRSMVRQHPKKERTKAEQQRRNRNTEACRFSRRAKKLEELVIERQYTEKANQNKEIMKESLKAILYIKNLISIIEDRSTNNIKAN